MLRAAGADVVRNLTLAWRSGWQPADLVRQARRQGGAGHAAIVAAAITAQHATHAADSIDPRWQQQVDDLVAAGAPAPGSGRADRWLIDWSATAGLGRLAELMTVFELLAVIRALPKLDELIPPPGGWTLADRRARTTPDLPDADRAVLNRVRGLLNKAESTEFEAEAEAFTAKAHELITRHAIDTALLHHDAAANTEEPIPIRIDIDDPYADAKSLLVQIVAEANRCRAIYHDGISVSTDRRSPLRAESTLRVARSLLERSHRRSTLPVDVRSSGRLRDRTGVFDVRVVLTATIGSCPLHLGDGTAGAGTVHR